MRKAGRPRTGAKPPPPEVFVRTCEECGDEYRKPEIEPWGRWLKRKFCSRGCYHDSRAVS